MSTTQYPLPDAPESAYAEGLVAFESGDYTGATKLFEQCLGHTEDPRLRRLAKNYLTDSYAKLGADFLRGERFSDALNAYDLAIHSAPSYPDLHLGRARALGALGRRAEQGEALRVVLTLNPRYVDALLAIAAFLYQDEQRESAMQYFEQACQFDTDLYGNAYQPVREFHRKDDREAVVKTLLAQRSPGAVQANSLARLAREHFLNGRLKLAEETYHLALLLAPNYPDLNCKLGQVHLQNGDFGRAVECLRKAVELNPRYVEALSYLGVALLREGSNEGSEYLARALELDPYYPVALREYGRVATRRSDR